ncbi:hypothetical protein Bpfe_004394 [Biomphalaria pfeifferi]|uniref:Uncharacterized protein n=1 Tax=Biomphalaria pfeifferi TaxID=112525 RepID=A0AAD8FJJ9_BIOPF|nr:hypothetical protein Bpfe_004394 [Biomphalaria pfeifferi]
MFTNLTEQKFQLQSNSKTIPGGVQAMALLIRVQPNHHRGQDVGSKYKSPLIFKTTLEVATICDPAVLCPIVVHSSAPACLLSCRVGTPMLSPM